MQRSSATKELGKTPINLMAGSCAGVSAAFLTYADPLLRTSSFAEKRKRERERKRASARAQARRMKGERQEVSIVLDQEMDEWIRQNILLRR